MMRCRAILATGPRTFVLCDRGEAPDRGRILTFTSPLEAQLWLRRALEAPGARAALRRVVAEGRGATHAASQGDEDVIAQLAQRLVSGRTVVVELPDPLLSTFGDAGEAAGEEAAPTNAGEAAGPSSDREPEEPKTWITIELVGEDDLPIPGERYRIELPDGSVREGSLDGKGLARVFEIDPGQCVVTFPDLDQEAWTFIETTGEP